MIYFDSEIKLRLFNSCPACERVDFKRWPNTSAGEAERAQLKRKHDFVWSIAPNAPKDIMGEINAMGEMKNENGFPFWCICRLVRAFSIIYAFKWIENEHNTHQFWIPDQLLTKFYFQCMAIWWTLPRIIYPSFPNWWVRRFVLVLFSALCFSHRCTSHSAHFHFPPIFGRRYLYSIH